MFFLHKLMPLVFMLVQDYFFKNFLVFFSFYDLVLYTSTLCFQNDYQQLQICSLKFVWSNKNCNWILVFCCVSWSVLKVWYHLYFCYYKFIVFLLFWKVCSNELNLFRIKMKVRKRLTCFVAKWIKRML